MTAYLIYRNPMNGEIGDIKTLHKGPEDAFAHLKSVSVWSPVWAYARTLPKTTNRIELTHTRT